VVEATVRSGTRHTADRAQQLGRELGAVPGPVTSSLSDLPNELIHDGAAVVRDVHDLLDVGIGVGRLELRATGPQLDARLEAVLLAVEGGSATCDGVALAAELDGSSAAVALARLELMGYVRGDAVGRYARTMLAPPGASGLGPTEATVAPG
jgi:DNA processing protein